VSKRHRGFEEGQQVVLKIGDLPGLEARLEQLTDDHALIGLFKPPEPPLAQIGEIEAVIESTTVRGLARLIGTMRQHEGQEDAVMLTFDKGPEVIQRRQFVRIDTTTPVTLTRDDGSTVKTHSLNLSGAGLLLGGPSDLQMDEPLKLDIEVGEDEPTIHARGRVVRETAEGHKGVRIEMIEEGDRERLIHFVFERQRLAPRVKVR
jgi:PilZ domain